MSISILSADFSIIIRLYQQFDSENDISTKRKKLKELNSFTREMDYIFFLYSFLLTFVFLAYLFKSALDTFHSSSSWIQVSFYVVAAILLVSFAVFVNKSLIEKRKKNKADIYIDLLKDCYRDIELNQEEEQALKNVFEFYQIGKYEKGKHNKFIIIEHIYSEIQKIGKFRNTMKNIKTNID